MSKTTSSKNPRLRNSPSDIHPSLLDTIVDKIVEMFGTWYVLTLHVAGFGLWLYFDLDINELTFWVSLEAIILSLLILMSQNRQTEFDRRQALADFEVDRHAEKQTRVLIEMIREIGSKVGVKEFEVETKNIKKVEIK